MMVDSESLLQRARLMYEQERYEMAEQLAGQAIVEDGENWLAYGLMSLCVAQNQDRLIEATGLAEQTVQLAPDDAWPYYVLSRAWFRRNQLARALESTNQAISLDPENATYYEAASDIYAQQGRWLESLQSAQLGLSLDPHNDGCSSSRTLALERMGRTAEALEEARHGISSNPNSSVAQASFGWALLSVGQFRDSQVAFREALRLDPSCDFARTGMIQALNANNPVFRWFHRLMMWMQRQRNFEVIRIVVTVAILFYALKFVAQRPSLMPLFITGLYAYALFMILLSSARPIFNAMLRFHPFGKHLLSSAEIWTSNLIAAIMGLSVICASGSFIWRRNFLDAASLGLMAAALVIPVLASFAISIPRARNISIIVSVGCFFIFLLIVAGDLTNTGSSAMTFTYMFFIVGSSYFGKYFQDKPEAI